MVGQRFAHAFLGSRRPPTAEEHPAFFRACAEEMQDISEANVTVTQDAHDIVAPKVGYVEPLNAIEIAKAHRVRNFFLSPACKAVANRENAELRNFAEEYNRNTRRTLNGIIGIVPRFQRWKSLA